MAFDTCRCLGTVMEWVRERERDSESFNVTSSLRLYTLTRTNSQRCDRESKKAALDHQRF